MKTDKETSQEFSAPLPKNVFQNSPALWFSDVPILAKDTHKYLRGHCLVVSGPEFQTGASRLAAQAALHSGAGAVTICGNRKALRVHAAHVTAVMLREEGSTSEFEACLQNGWFSSIVIGPAVGVQPSTLKKIRAVLKSAIPAVLDADALTSLNGHFSLLNKRPVHSSPLILTPHAAEFKRLFQNLSNDIHFSKLDAQQKISRIEQARAAARLTNAIIVLKGFETVIAAPDGRATVNTNAGPELATAGSGDVLSGIISSHLAQGMKPFEAAASGVWLHGQTGSEFGIGLTAERLVERLLPLSRHLQNPVEALLEYR